MTSKIQFLSHVYLLVQKLRCMKLDNSVKLDTFRIFHNTIQMIFYNATLKMYQVPYAEYITYSQETKTQWLYVILRLVLNYAKFN